MKKNTDEIKLMTITSENEVNKLPDGVMGDGGGSDGGSSGGSSGSDGGSDDGSGSGSNVIEEPVVRMATFTSSVGTCCLWNGSCTISCTRLKTQSGTDGEGQPFYSYLLKDASFSFALEGQEKDVTVTYIDDNNETQTKVVKYTAPDIVHSGTMQASLFKFEYNGSKNCSYDDPQTHTSVGFTMRFSGSISVDGTSGQVGVNASASQSGEE